MKWTRSVRGARKQYDEFISDSLTTLLDKEIWNYMSIRFLYVDFKTRNYNWLTRRRKNKIKVVIDLTSEEEYLADVFAWGTIENAMDEVVRSYATYNVSNSIIKFHFI